MTIQHNHHTINIIINITIKMKTNITTKIIIQQQPQHQQQQNNLHITQQSLFPLNHY